ncbi:MAG: hypothetical protein MRY32_07595 [Rickettsiales bacterium]|nr:hypothetical protein [Rickettsiales bacterium]
MVSALDSLNNDTITNTSQLDLIGLNSNPQTEAGADLSKLAEDFDDFLLLLTTQLENQDPTDPMETNEFTNQLVAFTGVEQQIKTNDQLEALVGLNQDAKIDGAVGFIGTFVDTKGKSGFLDEKVEGEDRYAAFAYELEVEANQVQILITNELGEAVYSGFGPTAAGKNRVYWDGVNNFNASEEEAGTYNISITAKNASGNEIDHKTYTTGRVTSAELVDNKVFLEVAGTYVNIDDVQSVY